MKMIYLKMIPLKQNLYPRSPQVLHVPLKDVKTVLVEKNKEWNKVKKKNY